MDYEVAVHCVRWKRRTRINPQVSEYSPWMFLSGKLLLRNWVPVLSALVSVRWLPDRDPYSAAHYVHGYDHSHMGGGGHGKGAGESKCCRTEYSE